jgi:two-component system chemotaxis sensor kinase CheA
MPDDDFTRQLQDACRAEGQEHVQLLLAALVKLEFASAAERPALVEQSFRSLHNLKGSAHAAEFYTIESICHPMEDVMSAIKVGSLEMNSALVDLLIEGVGLVESLFREEDEKAYASEITAVISKLKYVLGKEDNDDDSPTVASAPAVAEVSAPQEAAAPATKTKKAAAPKVDEKTPIAAPAAKQEERHGQETLRVSAQKLDTLLQQAEEMLSLKAMVLQNAGRAEDIRRAVENRVRLWSKSAAEVAEARSMLNIMLSVSPSQQEQAPWLTLLKALETLEAFFDETQGATRDLSRGLNDCGHATSNAINDLLDETKSLLMNPCSSLFSGFPVVVRQLARQLGKQVEINVSGGEIELDRRILGQLKDPLIHLLRNSLDHGIETPNERVARGKPANGTMHISAAQVDRMVEIRLADDGRGIDSTKVKDSAVKSGILTPEEAAKLPAHEALRLIFKSALSTSATITEISGRGLGLAIVEEKIEQLGGSIELETEFGKGTTFILRLPLTIATFRGVLVEVAGKTLAVPTTNIERVVSVTEEAVKAVDGTDTFLLDDMLLPLGSMQDLLRLPASFKPKVDERLLTVSVMRTGTERVGLIVDEVLGEQEVLVKSLGPVFSGVTTVLGVTVLGSGQVVPILNAVEMLRTFRERRGGGAMVKERPDARGQAQTNGEVKGDGVKRRSNTARVLVVDDMVTARMLMRNILESAGFAVKTANNGVEAWALLQEETFDIVVTDVEMPVMDGIGLTRSIRADEKLTTLPVVIVTSMASREDRERGVNAGANAYFAKNSFDEANLLDVVWKLV